MCMCITEAEVRVTEGLAPPCGDLEQGQLWVDTLKRGLYLCDGLLWLPMLQGLSIYNMLIKAL